MLGGGGSGGGGEGPGGHDDGVAGLQASPLDDGLLGAPDGAGGDVELEELEELGGGDGVSRLLERLLDLPQLVGGELGRAPVVLAAVVDRALGGPALLNAAHGGPRDAGLLGNFGVRLARVDADEDAVVPDLRDEVLVGVVGVLVEVTLGVVVLGGVLRRGRVRAGVVQVVVVVVVGGVVLLGAREAGAKVGLDVLEATKVFLLKVGGVQGHVVKRVHC